MKKLFSSYVRLLLCFFFAFASVYSVHGQTQIINSTASWKYLDNGSNQDSSWRSNEFDDGLWKSGAADLGYGNSPLTELKPDLIGYYFRKAITITDISLFSDFILKVRRDDGIVVYVNNVEVYRNNMPTGLINYNTKAKSTCSDDGRTVFSLTVLNTFFQTGTNVISAEVHNYSTSSSDLTFELQLIGNLLPIASCGKPNSNLFGNRNVLSTSAEVYWVPVSGVSSYNVEYRIRNVGANYSLPLTINAISLVLNNLLPSTNYEFIVQSICQGAETSAFSSSGWFTTIPSTGPPPPCGIPDANTFNGKDFTQNSAVIFWEPVDGVVSYNFFYKEYEAPVNDWILVNTMSDSVFLNNLRSSTFYEFIVQSVCSDNILSQFSLNMYFETLDNIPPIICEIPDTALSFADNITSTSAKLNWTTVAGSQSYNVEYRIFNSGDNYSPATNTTSTSLVLNNLLSATKYEYIIQTVCNDSTFSIFSVGKIFTTQSIIGSNAIILRGPYMTVSTSSGITIQWRTNLATNSQVRFGPDTNLLTNVINSSIVSTEHSITLEQLSSNTRYYYSIGPIGYILQGNINNYFYTAPDAGNLQPVKFWVTGDFGNGSSAQAAVRNSFTNYTSGEKINGWLWLGDNAYNSGSDQDYQLKVFDVYNPIFKNIPVFPAPGNHDYAQSGYQSASSLGVDFPYFNIFTLPSAAGTEKYYSTDYANIHFISLDSYGSYNTSSSAMFNWLNNDLANNTQQWTVVYFHHPPYSKGSHNSDNEVELIDMRNNIIPLLESYGVDLVLSGHSHIYERSYFMKGHKGLENTFKSSLYPIGNIVQAGSGPYLKTTRTGNGTVYVVCGVSGQSVGATTPGYPHNAMFKSNNTSNGSLMLEISAGSLTCKYLTSLGNVDDQFTIQKPNNTFQFERKVSKPDEVEIIPVIYPNPTLGDINIDINPAVEIVVSIYNATGNIFYKRTFTKERSGNIRIDKFESNLSSGVYIINVSGDGFNISNKLVIY